MTHFNIKSNFAKAKISVKPVFLLWIFEYVRCRLIHSAGSGCNFYDRIMEDAVINSIGAVKLHGRPEKSYAICPMHCGFNPS
jgi:hypothetical protein